jgi:hypothetical protein
VPFVPQINDRDDHLVVDGGAGACAGTKHRQLRAFRVATDPNTVYACEHTNGIPCYGSAKAPDTNWVVNYQSSSDAKTGVLHAFADTYLTGDDSLGPFDTFESTGARAGFSETVVVRGGTGTGTLHFSFSVTGTGSNTPGQSGRPQFQYVPIENGEWKWDLQQNFLVRNGAITMSVPITFDQPVSFAIEFYALAQIFDWVEGAAAHADYTAVLTGISVTDAGGRNVEFTLDAASAVPYDDSGVDPGLLPPADKPGYQCVGHSCLATWSTAADSTGRPLLYFIGSVTSGVKPQPEASSVEGAAWYSGVGAVSPCIYHNPATSLSLLSSSPISCGQGITGSAYSAASLGRLKAFSGLRAVNAAGGSAATMYGTAAQADVLFVSTYPALPFPQPVITSVNNDRVARFTFVVNGRTGATATAGKTAAGFFFRGAGGACPTLNCSYQFQPWIGPESGGSITIDIPFDRQHLLLANFELVAAAAMSGAVPYDATAYADFASTATLTGIDIFNGTVDNLTGKVSDFRILSASGAQYNQHGRVLSVTLDGQRVGGWPLNHGKLKISILPTDTLTPIDDVETASLTFGAIGTESSLAFCESGPPAGAFDKSTTRAVGTLRTLSCFFDVERTRLTMETPVGVLQGRLKDGRYFQGTIELGGTSGR